MQRQVSGRNALQLQLPLQAKNNQRLKERSCLSATLREMNTRQRRGLRFVLWVMALSLILYIAGRPFYWLLTEGFKPSSSSSSSSSCPPCPCDCSLQPLFSLPEGLSNNSITDCMKENPLMSEEMEKNFIDLLSEELKLKEAETSEKHRLADMALLEAKKIASQYQKEADKCNSGMDTCEEARERAEEALNDQMKITALWELRARQRGWEESRVRFHRAFV